jgi:hypothetical protein
MSKKRFSETWPFGTCFSLIRKVPPPTGRPLNFGHCEKNKCKNYFFVPRRPWKKCWGQVSRPKLVDSTQNVGLDIFVGSRPSKFFQCIP